MIHPLPAFQKRWMPVATIVSPSIAIRSVAAGRLRWTATTGRKPSWPVVVSCDRTRSPTWIDSIGARAVDGVDRGAGREARRVTLRAGTGNWMSGYATRIRVRRLGLGDVRLVDVAELIGPPLLPRLGLRAEVLAGERLRIGSTRRVQLVDLVVGGLDSLNVIVERLLDGLGVPGGLRHGRDHHHLHLLHLLGIAGGQACLDHGRR